MLPPLLLKYKLNYIRLFCSNRPQNLCWLCQVYSNFCIKRKTIYAIRSCRRKHKIGNVAPALAHQSTSAIEMIDPNHMICWIVQFGSSFPESSNRNNAACILTGYLANHSAVKLKKWTLWNFWWPIWHFCLGLGFLKNQRSCRSKAP